MLTACSPDEPDQEVAWSALDMEHLQLELIDDEQVESYGFGKDGMVSATIGMRDGPLMAPLFYWRIEGSHLIISEGPQSQAFADLHEPRRRGDVVSVRRGLDGVSRFRVTKRNS